ncbi:ABC transporter permease subunit [Aeromicrobium sp. 636]|uniref:ABC transporter permease n=1 Tax=Aeromicrobium senzhongii TaxID=2663859 RepID=A0A8I0ESE3_9ACTN|nr:MULTISPECIES: ABC transporter permease [Aeromicrobium]MBC9225571.1 ABC transporter permease [Aeromicrobium senzhongii]MCQ3997681.1 ABC transporter permease subunit [Aeromicrobium sp. 636]
MLRLAGRWVLTAVALVVSVSFLTFVLVDLVPGDAARSVVGLNSTEEQYLQMREAMGLDRPLLERYGDWAWAALHGDFGNSLTNGAAVASQLTTRLSVTVTLVVASLLVATVVGVSLGVAAAMQHGFLGRLVDGLALLGLAVPSFWFAYVLVFLFAIETSFFPATGYVTFGSDPAGWARSLVLPVLTLGLTSSAPIAKQTRDGIRSELDKDYVYALRVRGIGERSVIGRHVLRNAAAPVITIMGLVFVGLLSGTVLVETVFVLPGLGSQAVQATMSSDLPLIQAIAVTFTVMVVVVNLLVEFVYVLLNPRVRAG